jgi:serine/threonine protein kinase
MDNLNTTGMGRSNRNFPPISRTNDHIYPETPGEFPTIEGYHIRGVLGEGGMGVVYLAEQTKPIQRQVVIKVIKPGMDSTQVIARFEAER